MPTTTRKQYPPNGELETILATQWWHMPRTQARLRRAVGAILAALQAGELEAGQLCLFEGRLKKRQKGEGQWELVVSGFEVAAIQQPAPAMTARTN